MIFFTKNNYLGGKNSVRFIPQRGVAAKRYGLFQKNRTRITKQNLKIKYWTKYGKNNI
jgi:hypothetical protein